MLRVGVVNLMSRAECYETYLLAPLLRSLQPIEPIMLRLDSHGYEHSDAQSIQRRYVLYDEALEGGPLDGLVVSGAPDEELPFEELGYWPELRALLTRARREVRSTLGLCWGGLALASLLGLEKHRFPIKLFGVFRSRSLIIDGPFLDDGDDAFVCAHSRHTGIDDESLIEAEEAGVVRLLAYGREAGYSIFESADRRYLMHLGHPEYEAGRLVHEWKRDRVARHDVLPPANLDLEAPLTTWRGHRRNLFETWLRFLSAPAEVMQTRAAPLNDMHS